MSDETRQAAAPPPPPGAPPASAADEGLGPRCDCFERVEFWRGIAGVRRHQELVACETQRDLGAIVMFVGAHVALAGYLLRSEAKRRQKRVMAVDRP